MFCDLAVAISTTLVAKLFTNGPLEETFAAFATDGPVVTTWEEKEISFK